MAMIVPVAAPPKGKKVTIGDILGPFAPMGTTHVSLGVQRADINEGYRVIANFAPKGQQGYWLFGYALAVELFTAQSAQKFVSDAFTGLGKGIWKHIEAQGNEQVRAEQEFWNDPSMGAAKRWVVSSRLTILTPNEWMSVFSALKEISGWQLLKDLIGYSSVEMFFKTFDQLVKTPSKELAQLCVALLELAILDIALLVTTLGSVSAALKPAAKALLASAKEFIAKVGEETALNLRRAFQGRVLELAPAYAGTVPGLAQDLAAMQLKRDASYFYYAARGTAGTGARGVAGVEAAAVAGRAVPALQLERLEKGNVKIFNPSTGETYVLTPEMQAEVIKLIEENSIIALPTTRDIQLYKLLTGKDLANAEAIRFARMRARARELGVSDAAFDAYLRNTLAKKGWTPEGVIISGTPRLSGEDLRRILRVPKGEFNNAVTLFEENFDQLFEIAPAARREAPAARRAAAGAPKIPSKLRVLHQDNFQSVVFSEPSRKGLGGAEAQAFFKSHYGELADVSTKISIPSKLTVFELATAQDSFIITTRLPNGTHQLFLASTKRNTTELCSAWASGVPFHGKLYHPPVAEAFSVTLADGKKLYLVPLTPIKSF